ncbi:MAG: hypothetical protein ACRCYY_09105 [Trueperaceae bacterium]
MAIGLAVSVGFVVAVLFFRTFFYNLEDFAESIVHFFIGAWLWSDPMGINRADNIFIGVKVFVYLLMAVGSGGFAYYFLDMWM